MLIVTLPPIYQDELLDEVISDPVVDLVRYNTGVNYDVPAEEILAEITRLTEKYKKAPCLVDIKGRQLRITEWSAPPYGPIVLNHPISVKLPAKIYFRGDTTPRLIKKIVDDVEIYVDPPPRLAVGAGQSVNIIAPDLRILDEYFLAKDLEFIDAATKFGINQFLFSFTEFKEDIALFDIALRKIKNARKILKIESKNGLDLVRETTAVVSEHISLMAARDDLAIQVGVIEAARATREIIWKDREAICASRLLMGLDTNDDDAGGEVTLQDVSDLDLMHAIGYKHFMFSDGISQRHFRKAIDFWTEYHKK